MKSESAKFYQFVYFILRLVSDSMCVMCVLCTRDYRQTFSGIHSMIFLGELCRRYPKSKTKSHLWT